MKTFVVATDGSSTAKEALRYTFDLAAKTGAVVHVVHVAPETEWAPLPAPVPPIRIPHTPDAYDRHPLIEAREIAEPYHLALKTEVLCGNAVDEIVAYADSVDADLIVVGSRGRGALAGTVLGSVSLGVLHEARRPVLILRAPDKKIQARRSHPAREEPAPGQKEPQLVASWTPSGPADEGLSEEWSHKD
jgi:nucleotide-binding universal stress UspA family protein